MTNPFYLIQARCPKDGSFIYENRLLDEKAVAEDIYDSQYESFDIERVIEVDMAKGTAKDVSKDIAEEVAYQSREKERVLCERVEAWVRSLGCKPHDPVRRPERVGHWP
jgi:hypothetical protein